jgi:2-succinyl-5-enolpyruvyl-6-hydroxy-3-cyclohexene-1-carboxylate synthase
VTATGPALPATWRGAPAAEHARTFVDALVRSGVRTVVVSPGSRSTPYVWALAVDGRVTVHESIDERGGGFFALGIAKVTGQPVALLCTSGTAPAHYAPAVIEASMSEVPLVVVTADRPLGLQAASAPQTIDQVKLFGDHVRAYVDLPTAARDAGDFRARRRTRCCAHATRSPARCTSTRARTSPSSRAPPTAASSARSPMRPPPSVPSRCRAPPRRASSPIATPSRPSPSSPVARDEASSSRALHRSRRSATGWPATTTG